MGLGKMTRGTPNLLNLNLYYAYIPSDLTIMKKAFEEASKLLFNSTDGQMCIGMVRVSTNVLFQSKADVWVLNGTGGADSSGYGVLGIPDTHITLHAGTHQFTNHDGPQGSEIGQFGIVHELGHYVFNLYDEYDDGQYHGAYCVSPNSVIACIMDGGTWSCPKHHRTEWCTPTNAQLSTAHVTNPLNRQEDINQKSCWGEIVNYCNNYGLGLKIPAGVDSKEPLGWKNLLWIKMGDHLRFVLALDRSYSMSVDDKERLAKEAASLFVDLCESDSGEAIGVLSFSNTAISDYPMRDVTIAPDTRTEAINAINAIRLENMTALGDGLRSSLNEITGQGTVSPDSNVAEAIILLSDGVHNFGTETPSDVFPDLRDRGIQVFTIGLGDPAHPTYPLDEGTLLDISNQTGGSYTHALNATELQTIYANYSAEIRAMGSYPEATGKLELGASGEHGIFVDRFTNEEIFVLHWPYGPNALELRLEQPDGSMIGHGNPGMEYVSKNHYTFYRIKKPKTGLWKMIVTVKKNAETGHKQLPYTVQAMARAPGLSCRVSPRQAFCNPGEKAILRAFVYAGGLSMAKADVSGTIRKPDGKFIQVKLYDDGDWKEHGDERANDGVYSMLFGDTEAMGTYCVELIINNKEGITATPDERSPEWKPSPVSPFTRAVRCSFSVGRKEVKPPHTERVL